MPGKDILIPFELDFDESGFDELKLDKLNFDELSFGSSKFEGFDLGQLDLDS